MQARAEDKTFEKVAFCSFVAYQAPIQWQIDMEIFAALRLSQKCFWNKHELETKAKKKRLFVLK